MTARVLVDECVSRWQALDAFAAHADLTFVVDLEPSAGDPDVLSLARKQRRILLTEDADFGRLIFAERRAPPPGVILLSLKGVSKTDRVARMIAEAPNVLALAEGRLVVLEIRRLRFRAFSVT